MVISTPRAKRFSPGAGLGHRTGEFEHSAEDLQTYTSAINPVFSSAFKHYMVYVFGHALCQLWVNFQVCQMVVELNLGIAATTRVHCSARTARITAVHRVVMICSCVKINTRLNKHQSHRDDHFSGEPPKRTQVVFIIFQDQNTELFLLYFLSLLLFFAETFLNFR